MAAAVLDGKVYVFGGTTCDNCGSMAVVEKYDPVSDTWNVSSSLPTPRYRLAAVSVNGSLYAIGGTTNDAAASNIVEVFNPKLNQWTTDAPLIHNRSGLAASTVDDQQTIWVVGGRNDNLPPPDTYISRTESHYVSTNYWIEAAEVYGSGIAAAVTYSTRFHAIGGEYYGVSAQHGWCQTSLQCSEYYPLDPPPTLRFDAGAVIVNNVIYLIGGEAAGPLNATEFFQLVVVFSFLASLGISWTLILRTQTKSPEMNPF